MLKALGVAIFFLFGAALYLGIAVYLAEMTEGCSKLYPFTFDMNGDGRYTVSDLSAQIRWLFYLPGGLALSGLIKFMPGVAQFFELSLVHCREGLSFVVSFGTGVVVGILLVVRAIDA
jgi:hypothetical protein